MWHACGMQVVDYIINAVYRSTGTGLDDPNIDVREAFSGWEGVVLNVCQARHALRSPHACTADEACRSALASLIRCCTLPIVRLPMANDHHRYTSEVALPSMQTQARAPSKL